MMPRPAHLPAAVRRWSLPPPARACDAQRDARDLGQRRAAHGARPDGRSHALVRAAPRMARGPRAPAPHMLPPRPPLPARHAPPSPRRLVPAAQPARAAAAPRLLCSPAAAASLRARGPPCNARAHRAPPPSARASHSRAISTQLSGPLPTELALLERLQQVCVPARRVRTAARAAATRHAPPHRALQCARARMRAIDKAPRGARLWPYGCAQPSPRASRHARTPLPVTCAALQLPGGQLAGRRVPSGAAQRTPAAWLGLAADVVRAHRRAPRARARGRGLLAAAWRAGRAGGRGLLRRPRPRANARAARRATG